MTREYERPEYRGGGKISFTVLPGDNSNFYVSLNRGKPKRMSVRDCSGYVFKINKTSISSKGGASGLFKFVDDCLYEGFMDCYAWRIIDHVLANGK